MSLNVSYHVTCYTVRAMIELNVITCCYYRLMINKILSLFCFRHICSFSITQNGFFFNLLYFFLSNTIKYCE